MAKTANVYTRVDPTVKEQAERVLDQLGIPMSNAIGMFLRQVVIHNGIPFEVRLSPDKPLAYGDLTKEQFASEIQKGIDDVRAGRVKTVDEVEKLFGERYGL